MTSIQTPFTEMTGVQTPIVGFNRSPEVVVEASRAGALGVLAATAYKPHELDAQLTWIEEQLDGKPYGVDLLLPSKATAGDPKDLVASLRAQIPQQHIDFVGELLERYGIPELPAGESPQQDGLNTDASFVPEMLEVCFKHDITLIANALGTPPPELVEQAKAKGVVVASLVGKPEHARRQIAAGVDLLVAQGYEAGGHTGDIATMVLTPEIVDIAAEAGIPMLSAGGIGSGRQMAAALSLGAAGVWCGSVWLNTVEDVANAVIKDKFLAATSSDTLRSPTRTGKPARQLRSAWHDEWERSGLKTLGMPLQGMLAVEAWERIDRAALEGIGDAVELESFFIGQIVGSFSEIARTSDVVRQLTEDCVATLARTHALLG